MVSISKGFETRAPSLLADNALESNDKSHSGPGPFSLDCN